MVFVLFGDMISLGVDSSLAQRTAWALQDIRRAVLERQIVEGARRDLRAKGGKCPGDNVSCPHSALGFLTSGEYGEREALMKPSRATFCKGCLQQLHVPIPIHGPLSVPLRIFGLRPSRMNPNLCNLCETMFKRIKKSSQIHVPVTILFADVRGYTSVSELLDTPEVIRILTHFYEQCGEAVWEGDGIVNKLIGDAILAIFNFPIERQDHVENAVHSAITLQERWASRRRSMADGDGQMPIGVGVGIHTGTVAVGEVGEACRDFTAVGSVVNLASRLQGAAGPGEVLVTAPVYDRIAKEFPDAPTRTCKLKGLEQPVNAWVLKSEGSDSLTRRV